jgi:hypothetical protein
LRAFQLTARRNQARHRILSNSACKENSSDCKQIQFAQAHCRNRGVSRTPHKTRASQPHTQFKTARLQQNESSRKHGQNAAPVQIACLLIARERLVPSLCKIMSSHSSTLVMHRRAATAGKSANVAHEKGERKAYQTGQPDLDADRSHAQLASPLQPDPYSVPSLSSPQAGFEKTDHLTILFCLELNRVERGTLKKKKTVGFLLLCFRVPRREMSTRAEALALYRSLVRSSKKFSTYNFREYFLRRTRYAIVVDIDRTSSCALRTLVVAG